MRGILARSHFALTRKFCDDFERVDVRTSLPDHGLTPCAYADYAHSWRNASIGLRRAAFRAGK